MTLSGQHIWIIGASEGIGAALARDLIDQGAKVAISARNQQKLDALVDVAGPAMCKAIPIDVTDLGNVHKAWKALIAEWPDIDIVIYNAGTYEPLDAQRFNYAQAEAMLDVNFRGIFRVLDSVLPYFVTRNRGHIALVGSVAGYRGLPSAIGYGASKSAVIHLAENLRADLAKTNIKIQIINPGFVDTRLTQKNNFHMPAMITPEQAAHSITAGLQSDAFEIHFPKRFTYGLKFLSLLPAGIYFWLLKHAKM